MALQVNIVSSTTPGYEEEETSTLEDAPLQVNEVSSSSAEVNSSSGSVMERLLWEAIERLRRQEEAALQAEAAEFEPHPPSESESDPEPE